MYSTKHFPFSLQQAALTQELTVVKSQVEDLQREKVKDCWDYGMVCLKKKYSSDPMKSWLPNTQVVPKTHSEKKPTQIII